MMPGKLGEEFTLKFEKAFYSKGTLVDSGYQYPAKIISMPKKKYGQWYWRILNRITKRKYFNVCYYYDIKLVKRL